MIALNDSPSHILSRMDSASSGVYIGGLPFGFPVGFPVGLLMVYLILTIRLRVLSSL